MTLSDILKEYLKNSTLHGAKFVVDEDSNWFEKLFWIICIATSWFASGLLIQAALDAFQNSAISFVVETSYRDWDTNFPAIVVCEIKNLDRVQETAEKLWGSDHDFTLEEVLAEVTYFRGESYHTINECGSDEPVEGCFQSNFSYYAKLARSRCENIIDLCSWNDEPFQCCKYFLSIETELGICYAINSIQSENKTGSPKLNMISNKYTDLGSLKMEILSEVDVSKVCTDGSQLGRIYTLGEEDVPTLVTPKTEIISIKPYVSHTRLISIRNIANAGGTRAVSVQQRNCRFNDENYLDVHRHYSYSACTVQCRKNKQLAMCNCTGHLTPNTPPEQFCDMEGLKCLNQHYEDLSVIIPKWSHHRKGLVCDCLPSCTEVDISVVFDNVDKTKLILPTILLLIIHMTTGQLQHIAVIENDAFEQQLPHELRNPFYKTPRVREALAHFSWFGPGEEPVFDRHSEKIPRSEIYAVLSHAGLIPRQMFFH